MPTAEELQVIGLLTEIKNTLQESGGNGLMGGISPSEKKKEQAAEQIVKAYKEHRISIAEADDKLRELGFTAEEIDKKLEDVGAGLEKVIGGFLGVVAAAGATAKPLIGVAQSAARTGTQMETLSAALMGMQPEELNQLQADYRQIIQSSQMTLDEFNETVQRGASDMITYTGSLRDAIRVNAEAMNMAKVLGANQEKFMADQQRRFKELNRSLSMTAEQFIEMNQQLMNSQAVQSQLYRVNVRQRAAYMQDLQNTYEKLRLDGLTHESAQKMLETFEAIGAKSPRERLKEAAKLQAVMGAMGMGGVGARAGELLRGGLRGEDEKREFADIMKTANIAIGERMGQGFASEMMTMQMIQTAGLDQYLGPGSEFADFNIRQEAQIDEAYLEAQAQTKLGGERNDMLRMILHSNDVIMSTLQGPIVMTLGGIWGTLKAMQMFGAMPGKGAALKSGARGIKGAAMAGIRGLGARLPIIGGLFAGGMAGYEKHAELAQRTDLTEEQKRRQIAATGAGAGLGAGGGALAGAAAGAALGSIVPGLGTVIGGILGAVVGGIGGEKIGKWAGEAAGEKMSAGLSTLAQEQAMLRSDMQKRQQQIERLGTDPEHEEERLDLLRQQVAAQKELKELNKTIAENTKNISDEEKELRRKLDERREQAERHHEESKAGADKGFRVQWLRASKGVTSAAAGTTGTGHHP